MKFKILGKTESQKDIVNNIFKFYDTHGLHIADILTVLYQHEIEFCKVTFIQDALKANWKVEKIRNVLIEGYKDCGFFNANELQLIEEKVNIALTHARS